MPPTHSVIVIGAGISGLACAYRLKKRGCDVLALEASDFPGGMIRSVEENGYLFETGPQSFSTTAQLNELIDDLGLASELVTAPAKAPRYILVNGELRTVPLSPGSFLASSLLSWATKFSILREPFSKSVPPEDDESIAAFVRRKFTPELMELLVGPFVSGIYAGDPEKISLRTAFPTIHEAEKTAGSIVRGMKGATKNRTGQRVKSTLVSFRHGNQALPDALAAKLGDSLRIGVQVSAIARASDRRFAVTSTAGQFDAEHVVLATPTNVAAELLRPIAEAAASALSQIEYAPVAVVSLGFSEADVARNLDGFGFLVPRTAGIRTLGTIWNSSLFPNRSDHGDVLVTSFLGGATDPEAIRLSDEALVEQASKDVDAPLELILGPQISKVSKYPRAIPQYNLGHTTRLAAIAEDLAKIPGLYLTGNYLNGPSIGACVEHAQSVAESIRIS